MLSVRGGGKGGVIFFSVYFTFQAISRGCFQKKNRQTLFGPLKYRQTLFNVQILLYKDFYDSFRFTQQSPVVNSFPSFAIQMRVANWRPTYLCNTFLHFTTEMFLSEKCSSMVKIWRNYVTRSIYQYISDTLKNVPERRWVTAVVIIM